MEAITTLVKLVAVAIATTFVGAPAIEPPAVNLPDTTDSQSTQKGGSAGNTGTGGGNTGTGGGDTSNSNAANKIAVAGSTLECMALTVGECYGTEVVLFDEMIKVSDPKDLIIEVNAECALWTEVEVVDDDDTNTPPVDVPHSEAEARVTVQVLLDGRPVGVTEYDEEGKIVFCDRVHGMTLRENEGDEDNETISNYLRTRSANSFTWVAFDVGEYGTSIEHHVQVLAFLEARVNVGEGSAEAAVGKRTLIVEPVGMKNNEQL